MLPVTRCLKKREIPTVSEFDEIQRSNLISRDEFNGEVRFIIQDLENFPVFNRNYRFTIFQKKKIEFFPGFIEKDRKMCSGLFQAKNDKKNTPLFLKKRSYQRKSLEKMKLGFYWKGQVIKNYFKNIIQTYTCVIYKSQNIPNKPNSN